MHTAADMNTDRAAAKSSLFQLARLSAAFRRSVLRRLHKLPSVQSQVAKIAKATVQYTALKWAGSEGKTRGQGASMQGSHQEHQRLCTVM